MKLVTPLLAGMSLVERLNSAHGFSCYLMRRDEDGAQFALKHISIPASQDNIDALILTGAVADREAAGAYYRDVAEAQAREVRNWQRMQGCENLLIFEGFQLDPKEDGEIGYDFYLLAPYRTSLYTFLHENAVTQLQALNLGMDLCNALCGLRRAGYVHEDLKPENIFLDENGNFMLGDLGITALEDLPFASLPERHSNCYSAPELSALTANLNQTIDTYSVGMILYYLFNGNRAPFEQEGKTLREAEALRLAQQPLPGPVYADYELTEILLKACAPNPADRYETPQQLRQALMTYMQKNEVLDKMIVLPVVQEEPAGQPENPEDQEVEEAGREAEAPEDSEEAEAPQEAAAAKEPEEMPEQWDESEDSEEWDEPEEVPEAQDPDTPAEDAEASTSPVLENVYHPVVEGLDALLASVSDYIEDEPDPEPAQTPADNKAASEAPAQTPAAKEEPPKHPAPDPKKRKKRRHTLVGVVIGVFLLAVLAVGGYVAYHNWFCVRLSNLQAEAGGDYIAVSYYSSIDGAPVTATCNDTYGNSIPGEFNGSTVTFRGLTPGTQYFISFDVESPRILRGQTNITATTTAAAQVESFTASAGADASSVTLTLVVTGTEPEEWIVLCKGKNSEPFNLRFSGNTTTISDLTPGESYTFSLQTTDELVLSGSLETEYTCPAPEKHVRADKLHATSSSEDAVTVEWLSLGDTPAAWTIQCAGEGYDKQLTVTSPTATFDGITPGEAYTFTLTAEGMDTPVSLALGAAAPVVTSFEATENEGQIELRWESGYTPDGGWQILCTECDTGSALTPIATEQTEATLSELTPGAAYWVELKSADGTVLVGPTVLTVTAPEA